MDGKRFLGDVTAGLTVSFAAISLGAAFGAMSGRGAFAGMIGAAVIPIITSAFGGTRLQASGPTAPMTAVSALTVAFAYDSFPDKTFSRTVHHTGVHFKCRMPGDSGRSTVREINFVCP